jgi:hypothetical protein
LGRVVAIDDLHGTEEGEIKVAQHVKSEVDVELVLGEELTEVLLESGLLWSAHIEQEHDDVGDDHNAGQAEDKEE